MRCSQALLSRVVIGVGVFVLLGPAFARATSPNEADARAQLAGLRLPFIVNQGQVDARVALYAPIFAGTLFVTQQGELVYSLLGPPSGASRGPRATAPRPGWTLTETLRGRRGRPVGQDPSATRVSYFLGNDPARWRPEVPTYDQLSLGEVWPGVTVSLLARGRSIEKVFTIHPGASVARIRVRVGGASALAVDPAGALVARTGLGPVTFTAPVAYQERDGVRRPVAVAYRLRGREYGFTVTSYDRALPLVIDPLLQSTYLGGSNGDVVTALAINQGGDAVFVAGYTNSTNFPLGDGGGQPASGGGEDAFVARLTPSLTFLAATYLGGKGSDEATALALHPTNGEVYVAGATTSTDFPAIGGGALQVNNGGGDAFVTRLTGSLTPIISTYFGGTGADGALALAIHPTTGDVYVAGVTDSTFIPATSGSAQPANGGGQDAFVVRLTGPLFEILRATYLGGSGSDGALALAIHPATGDVYVAGGTASTNFPSTGGGAQPANGGSADAFVARLTSALTSLTQATYLGGSGADSALALAIHPATGEVYVTGSTASTNFPHTAGGAQPASGGGTDAFVARLTSALTSLTQATYLGGSGTDNAGALAIHPTTGDVYVAGGTASTNFPHTAGGAQPASGGGGADAFVARLTSALTSLTQATYLGGSGADSAGALGIDPATGDVYVAGSTASTNFPHTAGGVQPASGGGGDAFVARLTFSLALVDPTPTTTVAAVLPLSRSVQVGGAPATAFAAIINTGTATAVNCAPAPPSSPPANLGTFTYQTTNSNNQLIGTANTPANIAPGAIQNYVFGFTPTGAIAETSLAMQFVCDNAAAPQFPGVNNFFIVADTVSVPDTIALISTVSGDGVVRIPGSSATQLFAIGTSNVGTTGMIVVSGDAGGVPLPLNVMVCETTGGSVCLAPPTPTVTVNYAAGTNRSFAFFAQASGSIPFDPANNRVFARLKQGTVQRGATSTAVCTKPNAGC